MRSAFILITVIVGLAFTMETATAFGWNRWGKGKDWGREVEGNEHRNKRTYVTGLRSRGDDKWRVTKCKYVFLENWLHFIL